MAHEVAHGLRPGLPIAAGTELAHLPIAAWLVLVRFVVSDIRDGASWFRWLHARGVGDDIARQPKRFFAPALFAQVFFPIPGQRLRAEHDHGLAAKLDAF